MRTLIFFAVIGLAWSCAPGRRPARGPGRAAQRMVEASPVFARSFTGLTLVDAATGRTWCDVNGDKYFTPASNTKIFTLSTSLHLLGDSIKGAFYYDNGDSLLILPTGDPTFLHANFKYWQPLYHFLDTAQRNWKWVHPGHYPPPERLGPGWAWDDVDLSFSAERSVMPIYGNVRRVIAVTKDSLAVEPPFWQPYLDGDLFQGLDHLLVDPGNGFIYYDRNSNFPSGYERLIPVIHSSNYTDRLLADTLKSPIRYGYLPNRSLQRKDKPHVLYSCPIDTVYRRMMHQSDNLMAEQLLLMTGWEIFEHRDGSPVFNTDSIITHSLQHYFPALAKPPRWVDGSGLSRYNLATPRSLAVVLLKLWQEQPRERLFNLFPHNGQPGTTLDWFKTASGKPFVFAKTGSMSGVQCLSGYLVAKSGRVLIFSFMNNNFVGPGKPWREEMRRVLEEVWRRF